MVYRSYEVAEGGGGGGGKRGVSVGREGYCLM